jgi:fructose transport system ATP-binding protein
MEARDAGIETVYQNLALSPALSIADNMFLGREIRVARAAAFGSKVVIMDEPTAALGVKESRRVLELILDVKKRGLPIVLISHNMPHVFEVADRIHIHRLGRRLTIIDPKQHTMSDAVAFMTGAKKPPEQALAA